MDQFLDYFLPKLAKIVPEQSALIESIAAGYKICHPDELDGNSLRHGLVYADARDLSPYTAPTSTLDAHGTSLRNPSPETGSLTRISNCGKPNIVYENITGKEEIDVETLTSNINFAIQALDNPKGHPYLNELIQIFKSKHESRRSKALVSLLNFAITGSKKQSFNDSKYVYETENKVVLCSIRLSNHYSSNDVIREEETKFNVHPKNRLSLVSPDARKTEHIAKAGGVVRREFDNSNPITKTEIVINPTYLKMESNEPSDSLRTTIKIILETLKTIFSSEIQNNGMMGNIALSLVPSLESVIEVYQVDESGVAYKNGTPLEDK